jgi:hypothetical protein
MQPTTSRHEVGQARLIQNERLTEDVSGESNVAERGYRLSALSGDCFDLNYGRCGCGHDK